MFKQFPQRNFQFIYYGLALSGAAVCVGSQCNDHRELRLHETIKLNMH